MYYGKTAAYEKATFKSSPFSWAFGFWGQKPNQTDPKHQALGAYIALWLCILRWREIQVQPDKA